MKDALSKLLKDSEICSQPEVRISKYLISWFKNFHTIFLNLTSKDFKTQREAFWNWEEKVGFLDSFYSFDTSQVIRLRNVWGWTFIVSHLFEEKCKECIFRFLVFWLWQPILQNNLLNTSETSPENLPCGVFSKKDMFLKNKINVVWQNVNFLMFKDMWELCDVILKRSSQKVFSKWF